MRQGTVGSVELNHSSCWKRFRQGSFPNFDRKFFIVVHFAVQNSFVIRNSPLQVFWSVWFVRIECIWFVALLIVDVHLNNGKTLVQSVVYRSNDKNWSLLFVPHRHCFLICICFFLFLSFNFFGILSFAIMTFDKLQFHSQIRLSQINVVVAIRSKFQFYAV